MSFYNNINNFNTVFQEFLTRELSKDRPFTVDVTVSDYKDDVLGVFMKTSSGSTNKKYIEVTDAVAVMNYMGEYPERILYYKHTTEGIFLCVKEKSSDFSFSTPLIKFPLISL